MQTALPSSMLQITGDGQFRNQLGASKETGDTEFVRAAGQKGLRARCEEAYPWKPSEHISSGRPIQYGLLSRKGPG